MHAQYSREVSRNNAQLIFFANLSLIIGSSHAQPTQNQERCPPHTWWCVSVCVVCCTKMTEPLPLRRSAEERNAGTVGFTAQHCSSLTSGSLRPPAGARERCERGAAESRDLYSNLGQQSNKQASLAWGFVGSENFPRSLVLSGLPALLAAVRGVVRRSYTHYCMHVLCY